MKRYLEEYPDIVQLQGVEVSLDNPHLGAMGKDLGIPTPTEDSADLVKQVHAMGGLVAYNHPFGSSKKEVPADEQKDLVASTASAMIKQRALGCDALEVGYRSRGGGDLQSHQALWDACSRAGIFLTGIGTNDNHTGTGWDSSDNNFVTWLWALEPRDSDLLAALVSGHAYFGDPTLFQGSLDLLTTAGARMGQVAVEEDHGTTLTVLADGLPNGSSLEVISFAFDETQVGAPAAADYTRTQIVASDLTGGSTLVNIDGKRASVHRAIVVNAEGDTIALSNPIWLLTDDPSTEVPSPRFHQR